MTFKNILGFAFLLQALPSLAAPPPPSLAALDGEIPALMETWRVPGLGLAVVQDGEVIFSRGYGVREQGGHEAVDTDTLFAIGSITKSPS